MFVFSIQCKKVIQFSKKKNRTFEAIIQLKSVIGSDAQSIIDRNGINQKGKGAVKNENKEIPLSTIFGST